jgi:hypothetical protein
MLIVNSCISPLRQPFHGWACALLRNQASNTPGESRNASQKLTQLPFGGRVLLLGSRQHSIQAVAVKES